MGNFNWKSLTLEDLEWAYEKFPFGIKPRWHQLVSMAFAANEKRVGFWHDVGTGKTLAAYWTAQQWNCNRILVICPGSAIGSWVRDAKKTDYTYQIISGETSERREKIQQDQNVSIVQYESLKTLFAKFSKVNGYIPFRNDLTADAAAKFVEEDDKKKVIPDKNNPGKYLVVKEKPKRWKLDQSLLLHFDCIVFDEIHRCSDYSSLQSEICFQLSKRAKYAIGLSGTPVDRVLLELFNIHKVLDLGAIFGWDYFNFRDSNFTKMRYDWVIKSDKAKKRLLDKWATSSLSFDRSECFDLPDCQEETLLVQPTKEFRTLENRVILRRPIGVNKCSHTFSLPSVQAIKLKQLTDGFIYLSEDEGSRVAYRLKENPKLEAVLELLECGKKIIVFHEFDEVGNILAEALTRLQTGFIRIKGGLSPEERIHLESLFQNDSKTLGAVVQIGAGSEGWDGFAAEIVVFWDVIPSPKIRKQCIGRMLRSGQKNETLVYELILERSINVLTKENQGDRKTAVQEYMEYIQEYK